MLSGLLTPSVDLYGEVFRPLRGMSKILLNYGACVGIHVIY